MNDPEYARCSKCKIRKLVDKLDALGVCIDKELCLKMQELLGHFETG